MRLFSKTGALRLLHDDADKAFREGQEDMKRRIVNSLEAHQRKQSAEMARGVEVRGRDEKAD